MNVPDSCEVDINSCIKYMDQITRVMGDKTRQEIYQAIFRGINDYCKIPTMFSHCKLETCEKDIENIGELEYLEFLRNPPGEIINPEYPQREAIELFNLLLRGDPEICEDGDPVRPKIGAYLFGPPGAGKTHIMAAYASGLRRVLDGKLKELYSRLEERINAIYKENFEAEDNPLNSEPDNFVDLDSSRDVKYEEPKPKTGEEKLDESIQELKMLVDGYKYKPTDIIFIGFDPLYELCTSSERKEAMEALVRSPVVCIDDIHPKGSADRETIIQHVIERRYEEGYGGTFITSNLSQEDLVKGDLQIGKRLHSRCSEILYTIDFTQCKDWREGFKAERIKRFQLRVRKNLELSGHTVPKD